MSFGNDPDLRALLVVGMGLNNRELDSYLCCTASGVSSPGILVMQFQKVVLRWQKNFSPCQ